MANITRWDPFSDLTPLRNMMDRLMEDAWVRPPASWMQGNQGAFGFDLYETGEDFVLTATLPGVRPDDLELSVQGNMLTISGEMKSEENDNDQRTYHLRERQYGRFSRQITLPTSIQTDRIQANLEHGVLTLHVPKAEESRPRRIEIHAGDQPARQIPSGEQRAA